ncbi:MAG: 5'/3'-nucleotidase SurE [Bacteroidales bacterium]|nr:5'/3'-nucleotidase SurE [Bacteroidales bacterium]
MKIFCKDTKKIEITHKIIARYIKYFLYLCTKKNSHMLNILITNDDSIHAKGLRSLIAIARPFGNVTVVAPDQPMSGMGHAITTNRPLRLRLLKEETNYREYSCSGTPVDCVKMGLHVVFKGQKVDLILSGINHGSNASSNVLYSGTMGAAIEGSMEGVKSIGFSLLDYDHDADFSQGAGFISEIIAKIIEMPILKGVTLNVNIPNAPKGDIKGIKVCTQADAYWKEDYIARKDPWSGDYYWLTGEFVNGELVEGTDIHALEQNYVSVVPVQHDLTAFDVLDKLTHWSK